MRSLLVLGLLVIVLSCKDNFEPQPAREGCYKLTQIAIWKKYTVTNEFFATINFEYDDKRRVSKKTTIYEPTKYAEYVRYFYDSSNRLIRLETSFSVHQYLRYQTFKYNLEENMILTESFDKAPDSNIFELTHSSQIDYEQNKPIKSSFFYGSQKDNYGYTLHQWQNNRLIVSQRFDAKKQLQLETFYEYDSQQNPYYKLGIDPESMENYLPYNTKKISFKDYTGLLDPICDPCLIHFDYNPQHYPIRRIMGNEHQTEYFKYER